ncbi:MAG: FprA family A-type flavoprotein [Candidatus Omnitrophica bacterium]|nr:FprA family A-type flavoprotein [Candidatus Omnitrophota bacterium]
MIAIAPDIYWTGYIDWNLRNFHGYQTPGGSTYNAYLVRDEQPALIDTVKHYGWEEMRAALEEVVDLSAIRYLVSQHAEMDHSGSIFRLWERCPRAELVCSPQGKQALEKQFFTRGGDPGRVRWKVVNSGDELSLGKYSLRFVHTPMVHWPDSMVSFLPEQGILFSNDAFGQHYASTERFADEAGTETALREAEKYYANIVLPYGRQVEKVLSGIGDLSLKMICPSHGLIWRRPEDIARILSLYGEWARYESWPRAVVIYDTMWGSTEKMAQKLYSGFVRAGLSTRLINLQVSDNSSVITEVMRARLVAVGSPMLNNHVLPAVAGLLTYMRGLKPKNRRGFTFGSYGWAPGGFREMEDWLRDAGIAPGHEPVYAQYVPGREIDARLEEAASSLAGQIPKKEA